MRFQTRARKEENAVTSISPLTARRERERDHFRHHRAAATYLISPKPQPLSSPAEVHVQSRGATGGRFNAGRAFFSNWACSKRPIGRIQMTGAGLVRDDSRGGAEVKTHHLYCAADRRWLQTSEWRSFTCSLLDSRGNCGRTGLDMHIGVLNPSLFMDPPPNPFGWVSKARHHVVNS